MVIALRIVGRWRAAAAQKLLDDLLRLAHRVGPLKRPLLEGPPPNLIVTPHVAWAGREARQRLLDEVALNIRAFNEGRERNRVA